MKFDASKLVVLKRPTYYAGKIMSAEDFRAEQAYQLACRWQHNRMLHGYGVVVGLEVGLEENDKGTLIIVAPGYALDGWGREIVVPEPLTVALPGDRHDLIIYLKYVEQQDDDDSAKGIASSGAKFISEQAAVLFEPAAAERGMTSATRSDYAIPIARLRRPNLKWQRDRDFRPARAK